MTKEVTGMIFNIQKFSIHDGPGIRTLVFLKGCVLNCYWCSNPEGIPVKSSLLFNEKKCIRCMKCIKNCSVNVHYIDNQENSMKHKIAYELCVACGKCNESCGAKALALSGTQYTVKNVIDIVSEDIAFYTTSEGGMTLGGGEPTLQPEFALSLLKECKERNINTAIETCAYCGWNILEELSPFIDYFYVDIKHMNSRDHKAGTGKSNELILGNIKKLLKRGIPITIRIPIIPDFNDNEENILDTAKFLNLHNCKDSLVGVELLPYHKLGENKYKHLGIPCFSNATKTITDEMLEKFAEILINKGIQIIK